MKSLIFITVQQVSLSIDVFVIHFSITVKVQCKLLRSEWNTVVKTWGYCYNCLFMVTNKISINTRLSGSPSGADLDGVAAATHRGRYSVRENSEAIYEESERRER